MSALRIAGIPAADEEMASSRLRFFAVRRELQSLGIRFENGPDRDADVLYVQKRLTPEILDDVRAARTAGRAIVYDLDDSGLALGLSAPAALIAEMRTMVDVITVSSEEQRQEQLAAGSSAVEVVPNMIDYGPSACVRASAAASPPLRILWFGNRVNARLFSRHAEVLRTLADVQVVLITDPTRLPETMRGFEVRPWRRESFVEDLQSCHLSCLTHDGSRAADRGKSNTRMVTSIAWGVPAIVSATGAYERTAGEAHVPEAVFDSVDDLIRVVEHYRGAREREAYLERAQPAIWAHYAPAVVARRLLGVFEQAAAARVGK